MRFSVSENTGAAVAPWLGEQGHEVFSVYEQARGTHDDTIFQKAFDENWILISSEKDFGEKVYRDQHPHRGVILLRLEKERSANKIYVLQQVLEQYIEQLVDRFVVVTETQIRFARTK
jgi:predicted nuclease of predicted toxin-antitoxin system